MGIFDNITNFSTKCPKCGVVVSNFQSKSGPCIMSNFEFWKFDNFYSSCDNCSTWIEYSLRNKIENREITLDDYTRQYTVFEPFLKEEDHNIGG